jgi:hypothetical protein
MLIAIIIPELINAKISKALNQKYNLGGKI